MPPGVLVALPSILTQNRSSRFIKVVGYTSDQGIVETDDLKALL